MKNLWEMWEGVLDSATCDNIINRSLLKPENNATIGFNLDNHEDLDHRRSIIRWLDTKNTDADIAHVLMNFIKTSNRNNFGFDISEMNEIQFTEYHGDRSDKYDWHHDVYFENPSPYDRKLSIIVQLSHPMDYAGGDLEFFNMVSPPETFKKRGSVLVFPSFFPHRIKPVTDGLRYSLVSWIEGPKFR